MSADFDPRTAALRYAAAAAERAKAEDDLAVGSGLNALVCGLVYVGDAITESRAAGPVASKSVKVVAVTPRTVLLEVDGRQEQLFSGDTLTVGGLEVKLREEGDGGGE